MCWNAVQNLCCSKTSLDERHLWFTGSAPMKLVNAVHIGSRWQQGTDYTMHWATNQTLLSSWRATWLCNDSRCHWPSCPTPRCSTIHPLRWPMYCLPSIAWCIVNLHPCSSACVVDHCVITDYCPTTRFRSLLSHMVSARLLPDRPRCKSAHMGLGSCPIAFLWLWPATDHEPHSQPVCTDKICRWTEATPWSRWWQSCG